MFSSKDEVCNFLKGVNCKMGVMTKKIKSGISFLLISVLTSGTLMGGILTAPARVNAEGVPEGAQGVVDSFVGAARIHLLPNPMTIDAGAVQAFSVKAYDAEGKEVTVSRDQLVWGQEGGVGEISPNGTLTAAAQNVIGKVTVTYGELKAEAAVCVGKRAALVEDFEDVADITPSGVNTVTVMVNKLGRPGPVLYGAYSGKLFYDFTGKPATSAAYLNFKDAVGGTGRPLEGYPKKLGLWVYGDGNKHWLRGQIADSAGAKAPVDFTASRGLNWKGWKYVTTAVPSGLVPPLRLNQIYVAETDITNKNSGDLYFDQLSAFYDDSAVFHIDWTGLTPMKAGESRQGKVLATYAGSTERTEVTSGISYISSDPWVAAVNSSGTVSTLRPGKANLIALYGNAQPAVYELTVSEETPFPVSIALEGPTEMKTTETGQVKAVAFYTGIQEPVQLMSGVVFQSSDAGVASIDAKGLVSALKAGKTTISAQYAGKAFGYELTVSTAVPVLQSIDITGFSTMNIGDTVQAKVYGTYSYIKEPVEITSGMTFTSSSPAVATVEGNGRIKGVSTGTSTISVTYGGKMDQQLIIVNKVTAPPKSQLRAAWIATVDNIDWPKKGVVQADIQKQDFINILDELQKMGINAVVVQVKPTADAFYPSEYSPWSEWLTGVQGKDPGYDPLAFMLEEARKRNMEFHAWFNPYRISMQDKMENLVENHPARLHPDWVVSYGGKLYFNPGIPAAKEFIINSIMEVVKKYDIDAVHMDDYFYPYPGSTDFPDEEAYRTYGAGQFANKADWRRNNVDMFVKDLAADIKAEKPYVQLGISPFAIWRNKSSDPAGSDTNGLSTYEALYADTRKWVMEGWLDYIAPQVYWPFAYSAAAYEKVVDWWRNLTEGRNIHLYIGHAAYRIGGDTHDSWKKPEEMPNQLKYNQNFPPIHGSIFYNTSSLLSNPLGFSDRLKQEFYKYPALVPPMAWLDNRAPAAPRINSLLPAPEGLEISWEDSAPTDTAYSVIYRFNGSSAGNVSDPAKILAIVRKLPGTAMKFTDKTAVDGQTYTYVVTSVDRLHNESAVSNSITLTAKKLQNIELTGMSAMTEGETCQMKVAAVYNDNTKAEVSSGVSFTSSNPAAASVDANGWVTARMHGQAEIKALYMGKESRYLLKVNPALTGIKLAGLNPMREADRAQTVVSAVYSDGSIVPLNAGVIFTVGDPAVASIDSNGLIIAKRQGETAITAQYSGKTDTYNLKVIAGLVRIEMTKLKPMKTGETLQVAVTAVYTDGVRRVVTAGVSYSSTDPKVAAIDVEGTITALEKGKTDISVTYGSKTDVDKLVITKAPGGDK